MKQGINVETKLTTSWLSVVKPPKILGPISLMLAFSLLSISIRSAAEEQYKVIPYVQLKAEDKSMYDICKKHPPNSLGKRSDLGKYCRCWISYIKTLSAAQKKEIKFQYENVGVSQAELDRKRHELSKGLQENLDPGTYFLQFESKVIDLCESRVKPK